LPLVILWACRELASRFTSRSNSSAVVAVSVPLLCVAAVARATL